MFDNDVIKSDVILTDMGVQRDVMVEADEDDPPVLPSY